MQALILSDRPDLVNQLSNAVQALDFTPTVHVSLAAARDSLATTSYSLVLGQWHPDRTEGSELCRTVHEHPLQQAALVLLVTEGSSCDDFARILDAGADDYLDAPANSAMLHIRLRVALRRIELRGNAVKAEQELRKSVERFELAVSGANDGLWDAQTFGKPWHQPDTQVCTRRG